MDRTPAALAGLALLMLAGCAPEVTPGVADQRARVAEDQPAELLPLDARVKQELLEAPDAGARLERLRALLVQQGLTSSRGP